MWHELYCCPLKIADLLSLFYINESMNLQWKEILLNGEIMFQKRHIVLLNSKEIKLLTLLILDHLLSNM